MEFSQLRAVKHPEAVFLELGSMPLGDLLDGLCGYFEVTSNLLCAKVNSIREHDKALDLVEDVDASHLFDAQRAGFE